MSLSLSRYCRVDVFVLDVPTGHFFIVVFVLLSVDFLSLFVCDKESSSHSTLHRHNPPSLPVIWHWYNI